MHDSRPAAAKSASPLAVFSCIAQHRSMHYFVRDRDSTIKQDKTVRSNRRKEVKGDRW